MKRSHGGRDLTAGVHNPFGVHAQHQKPSVPSPSTNTTQSPSVAQQSYAPYPPAYPPPPPPQQQQAIPQSMPSTQAVAYPSYGYGNAGHYSNVPPGQPYMPPQTYTPTPGPSVPWMGAQPPPVYHQTAYPTAVPVLPPAGAGPPNKRVRYDQKQRSALPPSGLPRPPPSLPPVHPQRNAPFNPGPPPPHLTAPMHPPSSGKPPLPPQSSVRPNNPANKNQNKKGRDSIASNASSLPSNPNLPPKPSTSSESTSHSKDARKSSVEASNITVNRRHDSRDRGRGAANHQRGQGRQFKNRGQNGPRQRGASATPSESAPASKGKEKDSHKMTLTDFRIDGLELEYDGKFVWSWHASTPIDPLGKTSPDVPDSSSHASPPSGEKVSLQVGDAPNATESHEPNDDDDAKPTKAAALDEKDSTDNKPEKSLDAREAAHKSATDPDNLPDSSNTPQEGSDSHVAPESSNEPAQVPLPDPCEQEPTTDTSTKPEHPLPVPSKHGREEEEATFADSSTHSDSDQRSRVKKLRADSPARSLTGLSLTAPPVDRENSRLRIYFGSTKDNRSNSTSSEGQLRGTPLKRRTQATSPTTNSSADPARVPEVPDEAEDLDGTQLSPHQEEASNSDPTAPDNLKTGSPVDASEQTQEESVKQDAQNSQNSQPGQEPVQQETKGSPTGVVGSLKIQQPPSTTVNQWPAPDRLSVSYARNTRRLVIDADCIDEVFVKRKEGRIECVFTPQPASEPESGTIDPLRLCKGVVVEALDDSTNDFYVVERPALMAAHDTDPVSDGSVATTLDVIPPLKDLFSEDDSHIKVDKVKLVALLDRTNPLTEARWVRSGEADAWALHPVASPTSSKGGDAVFQSAWRGKVHVVDPDPPPTFMDIGRTWADQQPDESARIGTRKFVDEAFTDVNNIVELMLCLIRGGDLPPSRANPTSYRQPQVAELFARALAMGAPQPNEQSSLSLATYAMFRLAIDHGVKAGLGHEELHREVSEIVRQLPVSMLHKAMDAQYRGWSKKQSEADK